MDVQQIAKALEEADLDFQDQTGADRRWKLINAPFGGSISADHAYFKSLGEAVVKFFTKNKPWRVGEKTEDGQMIKIYDAAGYEVARVHTEETAARIIAAVNESH